MRVFGNLFCSALGRTSWLVQTSLNYCGDAGEGAANAVEQNSARRLYMSLKLLASNCMPVIISAQIRLVPINMLDVDQTVNYGYLDVLMVKSIIDLKEAIAGGCKTQ